ncbi:MAG: hypothetical protein E7361_02250 [Clostridiales bacterium]|nr:hypothetical protein [Clostridiales bacterium]
MKDKIKVGIIGSGAVGCILATKLVAGGLDVEYVYDKASDIEIAGLRELSVIGEVTPTSQLVHCVSSEDEWTSKKDIVFMVCKSTHMERHAKLVSQHLSENGYVVMLNNTLCRKVVTKYIDRHKLVGMFIDWSCEKKDSETSIVTKAGNTMLGVYEEDARPLAELTCKILSPISPTVYIENFNDVVLGRIVLNNAISSVGALCGMPLGDFLKDKYGKKLLCRLIEEGYKVYLSTGVVPTDYDGKLDYSKFCEDKKYRKLILKALQKQNGNTWSSIFLDLMNGKSIEAQFLIGTVVATGIKNNVNCIFSQKVYEKILDIEANRDTIRIENLKILYKGCENK